MLSDTDDESLLKGAVLELWSKEYLSASDVIERFNPQGNSPLRTELVLLSACESQVTDSGSLKYGGNTVKAMGTAFLVAGAENVVASHWPVNDESTTPFVVEFMKQVKECSKQTLSAEDYALILHRTRKWIVTEKGFKEPCDWGPFTIWTTLHHNSK